jgi:CO/xanthine dehydrogenase FAD-binding subunit
VTWKGVHAVAMVAAYRRPGTLDEALGLLTEPGAVVLAGGTRLNGEPSRDLVVMVDLQALGLSGVARLAGGALRIGSMTTLQQVVENGEVPFALRDAARRLEPSTIRAAATVGGCVATAEPTSEFVATLLVYDALVGITGPEGELTVPLSVLLMDSPFPAGWIITTVTIDTTGVTAAARVGRTVADRPIVAAVARRTLAGDLRLALTGVAGVPVLVEDVDELDPPEDFRGSSEYRRALAVTLAARVLEVVG